MIHEEQEQTFSVNERNSWSSMKVSEVLVVADEKGLGRSVIDAAIMESDSPKEALVQELLTAAC